jgi:hypothetical protein
MRTERATSFVEGEPLARRIDDYISRHPRHMTRSRAIRILLSHALDQDRTTPIPPVEQPVCEGFAA